MTLKQSGRGVQVNECVCETECCRFNAAVREGVSGEAIPEGGEGARETAGWCNSIPDRGRVRMKGGRRMPGVFEKKQGGGRCGQKGW